LEHLCTYVRTYVRKKNLDQQYSSMYASQTHITIHIPKAHDMYYPLMIPGLRDDSDKHKDKVIKRPNICHIFDNGMT